MHDDLEAQGLKVVAHARETTVLCQRRYVLEHDGLGVHDLHEPQEVSDQSVAIVADARLLIFGAQAREALARRATGKQVQLAGRESHFAQNRGRVKPADVAAVQANFGVVQLVGRLRLGFDFDSRDHLKAALLQAQAEPTATAEEINCGEGCARTVGLTSRQLHGQRRLHSRECMGHAHSLPTRAARSGAACVSAQGRGCRAGFSQSSPWQVPETRSPTDQRLRRRQSARC